MKSDAGSLYLSGKVALATGGGRGIGATTSVMLARGFAGRLIHSSTGDEVAAYAISSGSIYAPTR